MSAPSTTASIRSPISRRSPPSGWCRSTSPARRTAAPIWSTPTIRRCSTPSGISTHWRWRGQAESRLCWNGIPTFRPGTSSLSSSPRPGRCGRDGLAPLSASRSAPVAEPALPALQRWLQDRILAGGAGAADHVAGDARLSAAERVGIYAQAYRTRLLDTLRDEFPALRLLVGDTVFDLFAEGFL